jgi:hypothetical protein
MRMEMSERSRESEVSEVSKVSEVSEVSEVSGRSGGFHVMALQRRIITKQQNLNNELTNMDNTLTIKISCRWYKFSLRDM